MALIDRFLSRVVRRGELTLTTANGRRRTFGVPDPVLAPVAIRFTDDKVIRDILRDASLGVGESFMDGRLVIERGDIFQLIELAQANARFEDGRPSATAPGLRSRLAGTLRHQFFTRNAARRAKRNVARHYDLSDRLYDLFLDADRQYSCAYYFDPANTLEQAQLDKKAHIAAKLALEPGMRVLDIGCGWGGLALYLHEKTGAEVLGVTLSEEQLRVARARAEAAGVADKVRFELIDYRAVTGAFDRVVSVGMFEHVGPKNYRAFLTTCRGLLTTRGVALLHTIGRADEPGFTDAFTDQYIFPGGYIPALSEIVRANDGLHWYISDVEVLRLHYAYTIKAWYERTVAAREQIVALYDERFYRMWCYYLAGAHAAFAWGQLVNYQIQFTRDRYALPITRDYMVEAERRLKG